MELVGFVLLMGLLFFYEWLSIGRRGGDKGELLAFAAFMVVVSAIGVAQVLRWPLPNPTELISAMMRPFPNFR